jgi:dCMP deaminase
MAVGEHLGYGFSCPSIHAEANALLHASREAVEGATLYTTHAPCADCAKLISNSGVAVVVMLQEAEEHRPDPVPYLESCGITVWVMP